MHVSSMRIESLYLYRTKRLRANEIYFNESSNTNSQEREEETKFVAPIFGSR